MVSLLKPEKGSFRSEGVEKNPPNGTKDPIKLYSIITRQRHRRQMYKKKKEKADTLMKLVQEWNVRSNVHQ